MPFKIVRNDLTKMQVDVIVTETVFEWLINKDVKVLHFR